MNLIYYKHSKTDFEVNFSSCFQEVHLHTGLIFMYFSSSETFATEELVHGHLIISADMSVNSGFLLCDISFALVKRQVL